MNRLVLWYQRRRMERLTRGRCYVCGEPCLARVIAYSAPPGGNMAVRVDLHACPEHYDTIRAYALSLIEAP